MNRQPGERPGWRCQLRFRVGDVLAGSGEIELFRRALEKAAEERELTAVSVQAVAADHSVSLLVESACGVPALAEAVAVTEQVVLDAAAIVWPADQVGLEIRADSVAARRW